MNRKMSWCLDISTAIKPVILSISSFVHSPGHSASGQTYIKTNTFLRSFHWLFLLQGIYACRLHKHLVIFLGASFYQSIAFSHQHAQYKITFPIHHLLHNFVFFYSNCHQLTSFLLYHFKHLLVCVISSSCDFKDICILHRPFLS